MALRHDQPLDRYRIAPGGNALNSPKNCKCPKNSFFPALQRPERVFEIQSLV